MNGREELGMPKLYADIPDLYREGDRATSIARWDGIELLRIELTDLAAASFEARRPGVAGFQPKYIPRTGDWGNADVDYVTKVPPQDTVATGRLAGKAVISFARPTWQDMPTMQTIVGGVASLPVVGVERSALIFSQPRFDGRDISIARS